MHADFWRQFFDAIDVPAFVHDAQFRLLLANRAYCRFAGMSEAEAQGKPYWEVQFGGYELRPGWGDNPEEIAARKANWNKALELVGDSVVPAVKDGPVETRL